MAKTLEIVPAHDYFRATGQELKAWAADGDAGSVAEIARRKANRDAKAASAKAA